MPLPAEDQNVIQDADVVVCLLSVIKGNEFCVSLFDYLSFYGSRLIYCKETDFGRILNKTNSKITEWQLHQMSVGFCKSVYRRTARVKHLFTAQTS